MHDEKYSARERLERRPEARYPDQAVAQLAPAYDLVFTGYYIAGDRIALKLDGEKITGASASAASVELEKHHALVDLGEA